MKKRVFIVHGWDGYPEEGWFPWLKKELEVKGFEVRVPQMPDAANPRIEKWVPALAAAVGVADEETYFVGHSIGCQTVIRYLASLSESAKVGGVVCVAGWLTRLTGDLSAEEIEIARPWIEAPIDFEKVRRINSRFAAIFSDDDPFVLFNENIALFREKLGAMIIVEHAKGHINGEAGVAELPSARDALLTLAGELS